MQIPPIDVRLDKPLIENLEKVLTASGVSIPTLEQLMSQSQATAAPDSATADPSDASAGGGAAAKEIVLLSPLTLVPKEESAVALHGVQVAQWSPPLPNWDPWRSSNIDEGRFAHVSLLARSSLAFASFEILCMEN